MDKIKDILKSIFSKIKAFFKKSKDKTKKGMKKVKEKQIPKKVKNGTIKTIAIIGTTTGNLVKRNLDPEKEIKNAKKEQEKIEKNLDNETDLVVIKMYKKDINKTIKRLDKVEKVKDREQQKEITKTKEELTKLQEKVIKVEAKLNDEISILDIKKEEEPIIEKKEPVIEEKLVKKEEPKNKENKSVVIIKDASKKTSKAIKTGSVKTGKVIKAGSIKVGKALKKGTIKTAKVVGNASKKAGAIVIGSTAAIVNNISTKAKTKKAKKQEYKALKNNVKEINLKINRAYKEISKIKNNYSETKLQELMLVKEKVLDLKEDYISLRSNKNFKLLKNEKSIDNIDPNHLSHHGNAIYDLLDYVELSINEVKEGRITPEPVVKKEVVKEPEVKREKVITFDPSDFVLVKESIEKDITASLNDVVKIKNEVNDIPFKYKKSRLLNRVCGFFRFSMNTAISLIPFGIFKNKFVATLTSGIILNNRIKAMRSLVYDKRVEFIDYENIINNINDKNSCLSNTSFVLLDTVKNIDDVNSKLMEDYPNNQEALKLVKNLEEMKLDLLEENVKIESMLEDLNNAKNKVKTKVA